MGRQYRRRVSRSPSGGRHLKRSPRAPDRTNRHDVWAGGVGLWVKAAISVAVFTLVLLRALSFRRGGCICPRRLACPSDLGARCPPLGFTGIQRWRSRSGNVWGKICQFAKPHSTWIGQFINLGFPSIVGLDSVCAWKMHEQGITLGFCNANCLALLSLVASYALLAIAVALPLLRGRSRGASCSGSPATLAFTLGCAALAGLSMAEWIGRANYAKSLLKHLCQLAKDFNRTVFGNAAPTRKTWVWSILNHLGRIVIVFRPDEGSRLSVSPFYSVRAGPIGAVACDGTDFACGVGRQGSRFHPGLQSCRRDPEQCARSVASLRDCLVDYRPPGPRRPVRRTGPAEKAARGTPVS